MRYGFLIVLAALLITACSEKDCCVLPPHTNCYGFDVRQCGTDKFNDAIDQNNVKLDRRTSMATWLGENGIVVRDIKIGTSTEAVLCEACDICSTGERFIISAAERIDTAIISELRLMNFSKESCDIFN